MYFTDLDIPNEIVIFLLKQEVWDKNFNDGNLDAFRTTVLPKSKATKQKIERTIQEVIRLNSLVSGNLYTITPEDLYVVTIKNIDLRLYIFPERNDVFFDRNHCIYIGISFPGLKVSYKISTPISTYSFIDIISQCRYISEGNIHGTFVYHKINDYYQYRPEDNNLLENIRRTRILNETQKTTLFKPGHVYIMKNKTRILYLGQLKEFRGSSRSFHDNYNYGYSFFNTNVYENIHGIYESYGSNLYINLDTIDRISYFSNGCLSEFIDSQKGTTISEFIPRWIEFYENTKEEIGNCLLYNSVLVTESGIDQGELLKNDNPELVSILGNLCVSRLEKVLEKKDIDLITMYSLGCGVDNLKSLSLDIKDKISKLIIEPELEKMFKIVIRRMSPANIETIISENTSSKNIFKYMKSSVGIYYIDILDQLCNYTNSFGSLLYAGRDSELDSLIIESKKANFKK